MIAFSPRDDILEPAAAIALGPAARSLAERLLAMTDDNLGALRGVAGRDLLAITGAERALPWVDGIIYLGRDPAAPRLMLPAMLRPSAPAHVLEAAVARRVDPAPGPWAMLTGPQAALAGPPRIVPLGGARPIQRDLLQGWLSRNWPDWWDKAP